METQWFPFRRWTTEGNTQCSGMALSRPGRGSQPLFWPASLYFGLPAMPSLGCFNCWQWPPLHFCVFPLSACLPLWVVGSSEETGAFQQGLLSEESWESAPLISSALRVESSSYPWQRAREHKVTFFSWPLLVQLELKGGWDSWWKAGLGKVQLEFVVDGQTHLVGWGQGWLQVMVGIRSCCMTMMP